MLKAQLARALQLPMDTRAEQGLELLRELDGTREIAPTVATSEGRDCDRMIALLRARLSAR
jgi:hypothetical protein